MLFSVIGRHVEITDAIRQHAQEKAAKLPRYYDSITKVDVIVEAAEKGTDAKGVEVIASGERNRIFIAREKGTDVYTCIDLAMHKIERQLTKAKSMERDNKHG
ncbi:MAG TPA: ribosome-associated translation inhibitor RaiA [Sedimentisphaerales bacterium]|nr:ribosome-associated translation inhibitor RaiA [Sedimentisphaerales bacterium]